MGAPRPQRWPLPTFVPFALGLLLTTGCDKLTGGGEDEKTPEETPAKTEEAEAKKAAEEAEAKKAAQEAEAKKSTQDEAKKATPEDEAKKAAEAAEKAEEEAAKKAAEAAEAEAKSRPVQLSGIAVKPMGGMFGGSGMIEVSAKAKLNQVLGNSTYVHIKSLCKKDDRVVADAGYLNAHYAKPLEQYAVGEEAEIKGTLYSQGLESSLSPCQFEMRVAGVGGGLSVPVGQACWTGSEVTDGACDPELVAVAMSGASKPVEVVDLEVERSGGLGGSKGLGLSYLLQIHEPQENNVRLTFKTGCRMGSKSFADIGQANLTAGPFTYESGETVARAANLYWSSAFELAEAPNDCDITTSLWKTKPGTFGEYEEIRLSDSCFKDDKLTEGRCDPAAAPAPAPSPLAADSVTVDEVKLELAEPYGATGKFQLKIQADVTIAKPVSQNDGVTAKVSCKAGKDNRVESAYLFGPELYYLGPGETGRMTANAFGSVALDTKPKSCKVEFFGGPRFSPSGADGVDLGAFCLKKDKVTKGGKC